MNTLNEPNDARIISARLGPLEQLRMVRQYRHLLVRMVRKELQVKYKNSLLGFMWSMLNPALYLVVFWLVFQVILKSGIPDFPIYLLSGLLVWNLFSVAVGSATVAITSNGDLVGKVYFPREVLPVASVGAALVHFFLQGVVLLGALALFRYDVALRHLPAVPIALVILVVLTTGCALFLAAANVYMRDTQHLVELGLLAWFWMTPIVYHQQLVAERLRGKSYSWIQWLNPLSPIVLTFQRAIYGVVETAAGGAPVRPLGSGSAAGTLKILPADMDLGWYVLHLGTIGVVAIVVFAAGLTFFGRVSSNFAEEI